MTDEPLRTSADLIHQAREARRAMREAVAQAEALARRIAEKAPARLDASRPRVPAIAAAALSYVR